MNPMSVPDVLIVGGGVIGLTTAYYLARDGVRVTLVEAGEVGRQASWAGAGILTPGDPERARTPADRLRTVSVGLYPGLSAALREETGLDNGYRVCGGVELPDDGQDAADLPTEEWHAEGARVEPVPAGGLAEATGGLVEGAAAAVRLPDMAQVRNPRHLQALQAACVRRGVTLLPGWPVAEVRPYGVAGERGRLVAGKVLVAGGAWTGQVLASHGLRLPVRPVRGQMVQLRLPPGRRPIVLQGKRYLVPREDGLTLVGSTEEEAGFDAVPTDDGVAGLLAFARGLGPALGTAPVERTWAGLRPASADGLPYLGEVPGAAGLSVAAGHFRSGLQLSPGTGLVMSQLLTGKEPAVPLEAFRVGR
ncbi:MAG: glycine oxidase ThiO [Gemmataceae bacterium]